MIFNKKCEWLWNVVNPMDKFGPPECPKINKN